MQIAKLFLPEVMEALDQGDLESLNTVFKEIHPSDVAELLSELAPTKIAQVIRILRAPLGIEVFAQIDVNTQIKVLKHLGRDEAVKILEELSADDRVDLLQRLPEERVEALLPFMAQAERDEVRKLFNYKENTAGAIMTTEYASLPADITAAEALSRLHQIAPDSETIYYVYVTDSERRLAGTVSLREIILAGPTQPLREIMAADAIRVRPETDREEVARDLSKYDLLAIPVVDDQSRLLGIVTYDDAMDVIVEAQTEDVQRMAAVEPFAQPYFHTSFWLLARKRASWLLVLFIGEFLTGMAMRHYHQVLQSAITLAFFIPLIVSAGGNAGSQSVTLITRSLALGDVHLRDFARVFWREIAMGLVLGLILGTVGFLRAQMWNSGLRESFAVGIAVVGVVLAGSLVGGILPLALKRVGLDPAIMSSPFVATLVDVIGIVIFFSTAQLLMMN